MASKQIASAPGKLFLAGEYAVLAGGWCLVAAIDRRVMATLREDASGYRVEGASLSAEQALPRAALRAAGLDEAIVARCTTDVSALYEGERKLGLGSSAASTVALLRAASALDAGGLFEAAFGAHRELQGGRGSGADVAAACWGGLLAYRLHEPQPPFEAIEAEPLPGARDEGLAQLLPVSWPEELVLEAVWTGEPASSTELVGRVERARASDPRSLDAILGRIASAARAIARALASQDAGEVLAHMARAEALMGELGERAGAPILCPAHQALSARARGHQLVCKPSGAGGGDLSLLLGPPGADWEGMMAGLPAGCQRVSLDFFGPGARRQ